MDYVDERDVVTFTGSAATGRMLKANPRITEFAVPFNMEADSLNSAILGPDAVPGTPEFDLFVKEVRKEMTVKCGQKCTAVRRIFVPESVMDAVQEALVGQLAKTTIGDPQTDGVRMGALVGKAQCQDVLDQVKHIEAEAECVFGASKTAEVIGAELEHGAFLPPMLMRHDRPHEAHAVHDVEAFGPVSTLMPYGDLEEAVALAARGKGSLCCSITTFDRQAAATFVREAAPMHGRILVLDRECAKESTGHGSPMPLLVHGGPGRAGGGEEMGGLRGIKHYMQRTAIQGHPTTLSAITEQYQPVGRPESEPHVFRKHFEELEIGDTVTTARHTVTEADIVNFANVSGDHFYAHVDETSLDGTMFEGRVAHGYYILSKAAGLFVEPRKGPVLLNYGIDECRFTKPVYPGTTIGVKLTVVEKIAQERREPEDVAKGIVRYRVEVDDHEGEVVAVATILTMVKKPTKAPTRLMRRLGLLILAVVLGPGLGLEAQDDLDSLDKWVREMHPDPFVRCGESAWLRQLDGTRDQWLESSPMERIRLVNLLLQTMRDSHSAVSAYDWIWEVERVYGTLPIRWAIEGRALWVLDSGLPGLPEEVRVIDLNGRAASEVVQDALDLSTMEGPSHGATARTAAHNITPWVLGTIDTSALTLTWLDPDQGLPITRTFQAQGWRQPGRDGQRFPRVGPSSRGPSRMEPPHRP